MNRLSTKQRQDSMQQITKRPDAASISGQARRVRSQDLFAGAKEMVIEHAGDEYRLRLTAQGKLILTK